MTGVDAIAWLLSCAKVKHLDPVPSNGEMLIDITCASGQIFSARACNSSTRQGLYKAENTGTRNRFTQANHETGNLGKNGGYPSIRRSDALHWLRVRLYKGLAVHSVVKIFREFIQRGPYTQSVG